MWPSSGQCLGLYMSVCGITFFFLSFFFFKMGLSALRSSYYIVVKDVYKKWKHM